jgi:hypothetical protein
LLQSQRCKKVPVCPPGPFRFAAMAGSSIFVQVTDSKVLINCLRCDAKVGNEPCECRIQVAPGRQYGRDRVTIGKKA